MTHAIRSSAVLSASLVLLASSVASADSWYKPFRKRPGLDDRRRADLAYQLEPEFARFNDRCGLARTVAGGGPAVVSPDTYTPLPKELQDELIGGFPLIYIPSKQVEAGRLAAAFQRTYQSNSRSALRVSLDDATIPVAPLSTKVFLELDSSHWNYEATCATSLRSALDAGLGAGVVDVKLSTDISSRTSSAIQLTYGALRSTLANNIALADAGGWNSDIQTDYEALWHRFVARPPQNDTYALQRVVGIPLVRRESTFRQGRGAVSASFDFSFSVFASSGSLEYDDRADSGYRAELASFFLEGRWGRGELIPLADFVKLPSPDRIASALARNMVAVDRGDLRTAFGTDYLAKIELSGIGERTCRAGWEVSAEKDSQMAPASSDSLPVGYSKTAATCLVSVRMAAAKDPKIKGSAARALIRLKSKDSVGGPNGSGPVRIEKPVEFTVYQGDDVSVSLPQQGAVLCTRIGADALSCRTPITVKARTWGVDASKTTVGSCSAQCFDKDGTPVEASVSESRVDDGMLELGITPKQAVEKCQIVGGEVKVFPVGHSEVQLPLPAIEVVPVSVAP